MAAPPLATSSFLATRRGRLVLAFLLAVAFLDFLDASIVNVALPSIARDLHFSVQSLQWVLSGYIVTYGGFLMLGGRAADLLGRRRILVAGTALFGLASLAGGLAPSAGTLVGAPDEGWGAARTIGEFAAAAALLTGFVLNERRHRNPLVPLSIFRIKGLAAADATQVIAMAGFYSAFFFLTLYMQNVLGFSAVRAGAAYVPAAAMVAVSAGIGTTLITRVGTRPLI